MGAKFFGVDIQATIADAFGTTGLPAMTLRKVTQAPDNPAHLTKQDPPTTADFATFGTPPMSDAENVFDASQIEGEYRIIRLLGKKLADAGVAPTTEDMIVDSSGQVYGIVKVHTDAATATYTCAVRG